MRKNNKLRIGLFLAILFVFAIIFNCRTAKNSIQKSKEDFKKEELKINKIDSTINIQKLTKIDNSYNSKWLGFWNKYDATFSGESNDDTFTVTFTENGFTAKGKGILNVKSENQKKDSSSNNKVDENIQKNTFIKSDSKTQNQVNESKSKIDKSKENKSVGPTWNVTIILIVSALFIIYLGYRYFTRKR